LYFYDHLQPDYKATFFLNQSAATTPRYAHLFLKHRACVLIPTYNNATVLAAVLQQVRSYTASVLVVNDGSTDATRAVLAAFQDIRVIDYAQNKGKGWALRRGFCAAAAAGYDYAIVMDSDGQHDAQDLAVFLEKLDEMPDALIVGARNLNQKNVPAKSTLGNRFSNFWFWVATGIKLPDTQSGYRLYPLKKLAGKRYFTRKYEFEIEIMVRAAWSGVPIAYVPVSVYYPPAGERISHFRPFKDFARISVLNTVLVLLTFLWIKPRDFFRLLLSRAGWGKILRAVFIHPQESNWLKAASIGFGVFMGIVPLWGFQLLIGIPLAILFRLNKALFLLAANISIFPFTPFWWMASLVTGKWLLGYREWSLAWRSLTLERVRADGISFFLGGSVLALCMGLVAFLVTYVALFFFRKKSEKQVADF
jgi:glycosyltransferase involved in cell wall biosynthesis